MGGAVSAGEDNEELIDKLVNASYIKSPSIELFFRVVDRGFYFLPSHRTNAYRDQAWRFNSIHISAPCIYSEVLEALQIKPGMSFLNIGSGTGYLSTLVGLLLGGRGINHGIELHREVVTYSQNKLQQFLRLSPALYLYDFAEPRFILGNAITVLSDDPTRHQYDRVYCGAAVPPELESFMKSLLKINGILVMPANEQLMQVTRKATDDYDVKFILPVNFASLILPCNPPSCNSSPHSKSPDSLSGIPAADHESNFLVKIPENQPSSLKLLCRNAIIGLLRVVAESDTASANCHTSHIKSQVSQPVLSSSAIIAKRFSKCLYRPSVEELELSWAHQNSATANASNSSDTGSCDTVASTSTTSSSTTSKSTKSSKADSSGASSSSNSWVNVTSSSDEAAGGDEEHPAPLESSQLDTQDNVSEALSEEENSDSTISSSPAKSTDNDEISTPDTGNRLRQALHRFITLRRAGVDQMLAERPSGNDKLDQPEEASDEPATTTIDGEEVEGHSTAKDDGDARSRSSMADSGLSAASPLEGSSKRSISLTEEETEETVAGSSSGPPDSGRSSGHAIPPLASPVLAARVRQRAIEALRHRRRVKARRIAIYSTDSDDSEAQEGNGESGANASSRRRAARTHSDDDSFDSSEEERIKNEEADLLIRPWAGNIPIRTIEDKIRQLPLPPTLQVYVNFSRPLKPRN